jgi:rubrerythrin
MATSQNLKDAFAGESQANRKYLAFAKRAEEDGKPMVAKLFRAAAEAETVHAHAHLRVMGGVRGTADNVQAAIEGEGYEFKQMYPAFIAEAEKEGNAAAVQSFKFANAVEKIHYGLYSQALEAIKAGRDLTASGIWVCPVCGNTFVGTAPEKCPVCNGLKARFVEIR